MGGPLSYGFSHLVFLSGLYLAGRDSLRYVEIFPCGLFVPWWRGSLLGTGQGIGSGQRVMPDRKEIFKVVSSYLIKDFEVPSEKIRPEANLFKDLGLDSIDALDWFAKMSQRSIFHRGAGY